MEEFYGNGYWQETKKPESTGLGIASLILGICSLLLFCTCVNWITGILAIVFGVLHMKKSSSKGIAIAGVILAGVSMLFSLLLYGGIFFGLLSAEKDYESYYNQFFDEYYDDDYDEYDFSDSDGSDANKFL